MTIVSERRTYWLSFCDTDKPVGSQFLGAVVVDVTRDDADLALLLRPTIRNREEGPWIAAALHACWAAGVNPGGQVGSYRIDEAPPEVVASYPRLMLMDKATIERLEPADDNA